MPPEQTEKIIHNLAWPSTWSTGRTFPSHRAGHSRPPVCPASNRALDLHSSPIGG